MHRLTEFLRLLDSLEAPASSPTGGLANPTQSGEWSSFGWSSKMPYDILLDNANGADETVRSEKFRTKNWNGQVLAKKSQ